MSWRTEPPFRADHVGSLLRPPALLHARADYAAGRIDADELRAVEDDADARGGAHAGGDRPAGGDRRRAAPRLLAHGLHLPARRRQEARLRTRGRVPQPGRQRRLHAALDARRRAAAARAHDLRRRLRVPARQRDDGDAEAHDPVAEHGALPRRPRRDRRDGLSRPGRVLGRPHGGLPRRGQPARRAGLPLPAARRHQPRLPQRPEAARAHRGDRRGSGAPARGLHPPPQRGDREPARRAWRSRRTCAAATSARPGSPRATTSTSPRCCSTSSRSTASSWSGTTSARAASSRCASCRRASRSCSASSRPRRGELERKDELKRRIEEAAKFADIDQLCLSPQCGFSSTVDGNDLTVEQQAAKLRLVVETAREVWG